MKGIDVSIGNDMTMRGGATSALGRIDQYELLRELGGGGFGCVYLAKDSVAGVEVAVKGLPPEVRHNKEELERIRENFALVSRLHHPNIAAALVLHPVVKADYASRDAMEKLRVFERDTMMVMEYAPGVTLSQWCKQFPGRKVPVEAAMEIVRQVAAALDYAHGEKIVHRDVKPSNVMIETKPDGSIVARVLDFGLAAEIRSSMGRVSREIRDTSGTRPYMAPEQWRGAKQGPATDQYALAVLAYELLTGEVPFASVFDTGDPVVMLNAVGQEKPELSAELPRCMHKAFATALAKTPTQRFATCGKFADALLSGGGGRHSGRLRWWAAAAFLIVVALGGGGYLWRCHEREAMRLAEVARQDEIRRVQESERQAEDARRVEAERQAEIARKKQVESDRLKQAEEKKIAAEKAAEEEKERAEAERKRLADEERRKKEEKERKLRLAEESRRHTNRLAIESAFAENRMDDGLELSRKAYEESGAICLGLGRMYLKGVGSVRRDYRKAREYLEKAVEQYGVGGETAAESLEEARRMDSNQVIIDAVKSGDLQEIKKHVNSERPCFDVFDVNDSLMHVAARYADSSVLDYMMSLGYAVRQRMHSKDTTLPPFFRACANTNATRAASCINWFISKGADVNECLDEESMWAYGQFCPIGAASTKEAFDLLLAKGAKTDFKAPRGLRLIHFLAMSGACPAVIEAALAKGENADCPAEGGMTPVMFCVQQRYHASSAAETLKALISRGVNKNVRDGYGRGLLHDACSHASRYYEATPDIVKILIENGADVNEAIPPVGGKSNWRTGCTPLHLAINEVDPDVVSVLIEHGADVNARDPKGRTPLMLAIEEDYNNGQDAIVELLLRHGAKVDAVKQGEYEQGFQAIHLFAKKDRRGRSLEAGRILTSLLGHGADINAPVGPQSKYYQGYTPLMLAVKEWKHFDGMTCRLLAGRGANLRLTSASGVNALHIAAEESTTNAISYLVAKGILVDSRVEKGAKHHAGDTPLLFAIGRGRFDNARKLLELGAFPNSTYYLGAKTALMLAVEKSRADFLRTSGTGNAEKDRAENAQVLSLLRLLILKGAYVNALDDSDKTALDYACLWREGAEYLKSCGAKRGSELK